MHGLRMVTRRQTVQAIRVSVRYLIVLAVALTVLGACARGRVNHRLREYKTMLEPMIGVSTRENIIERFGPPLQREQIGSLEVWKYHRSYGNRTTAIKYGNRYSPAHAVSHEVYDELTLTFGRNGVLRSWNAYVQR